MKLSQHLDALEQSCDILADLSFTQPRAFQNTLLSRVSITQVIRDAEPHESALYTSSAHKKRGDALPDTGAGEVLRRREADLEVLFAAVERILDVYPVDVEGARSRLALMRHKAETLRGAVRALEAEVEEGRRRLDALSSGGYGHHDHDGDDEEYDDGDKDRDGGDHDAMWGDVVKQETSRVTEEMIKAEEEEIARLEHIIESKSRR